MIFGESGPIGSVKATQHSIELKEKTRPIRRQLNWAGPRVQKVLCVHIDKELEACVIESDLSN